MNYTRATLLFVSGIISIAALLLMGTERMGYGFLIGYGYTALACGMVGALFTYLKNQKAKKGK
ncbi:hypothetical protein [Pontibacter korlensis]|nr:hypothetical protein [Pontibacter korlensis]